MPWYITDGVLQRANCAPAANSILTNITGEGEVVVPEGVTSIGDRAFYGCESLKSIRLPQSAVSIGDSAFYWCTNLTSAEFPYGVTSIGESAFKGCGSLTSITLPPSVKDVGESAFEGCLNLVSVALPTGLTNLRKEVFFACMGLTSIDLPEGLTSIEEGAFRWCGGLTNMTIPPSVTNIGENAFSECRSLTSIMIPSGVTSLGKGAFCWCESLTSLVIDGNLLETMDKEVKKQLTEIRCIGNVDKVPSALRAVAFVTFAKNEAEYSQKLKNEHIAVLKKSASKLAEAAVAHRELLHLMCREKLISARNIGKYIEEATRWANIEATAVLLDYQANVLTRRAGSKAREKRAQK